MKFGNYLMEHELVQPEELKEALHLQRFKKEKMGRLLKDLGHLNEKSLDRALVGYLKPHCSTKASQLMKMKEKMKGRDQISSKEKAFLRQNQLEVIHLKDCEVILVGSQYRDAIIQKAEMVFGRHVLLKVVEPKILDLLISSSETQPHQPPKMTSLGLFRSMTEESQLEEQDPYSQLIRESIDEAFKQGASDIHYEPFHSQYVIRFRVHGLLSDWKVIEGDYSKALTTKLKFILNMDPAIVGCPQDSRASFEQRGLDIRASSLPVIGRGEKIVLRLQRMDETFLLEDLGLSKRSYNKLLSIIQKRDGLILISGPTGSGKTSTLYALLHKMDKYGKNISTIENPVERRLDRISQANIQSTTLASKNLLSTLEPALMRQDPDIILMGEIRDKDSAELCMRLSSTGHLVLSTIHANGALEVIERLQSLGVEGFSIKSNLRLSMAQRLVKKICPLCSKQASDDLTHQALHALHNCHTPHALHASLLHAFQSKEVEPHSFKTLTLKAVKSVKRVLLVAWLSLNILKKSKSSLFWRIKTHHPPCKNLLCKNLLR